jgi:fatty acid desaturase
MKKDDGAIFKKQIARRLAHLITPEIWLIIAVLAVLGTLIGLWIFNKIHFWWIFPVVFAMLPIFIITFPREEIHETKRGQEGNPEI